MEEKRVYDITEVCKMLATTSRTLRFYEEKGIIESTKSSFSSRRQYTCEQVNRIRNVIALRTLGLSIKAIVELQGREIDLKGAVMSRRAELAAVIEEKNREIRILNETLAMIDAGKDVLKMSPEVSVAQGNPALADIAQTCAEAIVFGNSKLLYAHLSPKMIEYMPKSVYDTVRFDTLEPIGGFVSFDRAEQDSKHPNVIYQYVKYERLGLKIKFVFHDHMIHGLWMGYYKL